MRDVVIGIDPGGQNKNGVALIFLKGNKIIDVKTKNEKSVNTIIRWISMSISSNDSVIAIGIDSCLWWSTYRCGWRPMDRYLKMKYKLAYRSVFSINGARGSMLTQGIMLGDLLSKKFPNAIINETHPKVAYYAETKTKYTLSKKAPSKTMNSFLINKIRHVGNLNKFSKTFLPQNCSEHEWDAIYSALFTLEYGLQKVYRMI